MLGSVARNPSYKEHAMNHFPDAIFDEKRIEHYRRMIRRGEKFANPIARRTPDGEYQIVDGFHRIEALLREGAEDVSLDVLDPSNDSDADCYFIAREANAYHRLN
jgi:ParB-like chromosome segregation protein Spo0J